MLKLFVITLIYYNLSLIAGTFSTNPTQITPDSNLEARYDVTSCSIESTNQIIFAWTDGTSYNPYYIIYDNKIESFLSDEPIQIGNDIYTKGSYRNIYCCYNSQNDEVIFCWASKIDQNPYYAVYDIRNETFTTKPTQIAKNLYTKGVYFDIFCCYNSQNNEIVFSWQDNEEYNPYYAIYDAESKNFTTRPTQIAKDIYTKGVYVNIYCCYNSRNNEIVFSWNTSIPNPPDPYYAVYDAESKIFTTNPTQIAKNLYTKGVYFDIFCCYNSQNNKIVFSWQDNEEYNPYYTIYDAESKSFTTRPTQIAKDIYTKGVYFNIYCCYNSRNNEVIFSWFTSAPRPLDLYYAIYDAESKIFTTNPTQIAKNTYTKEGYRNVHCYYNSRNNGVIFSWADYPERNPYYAIYIESLPPKEQAMQLLKQKSNVKTQIGRGLKEILSNVVS